ncbi:DUF732 domain-containing protein [Mycobacterium kyorinense]|uniref:DUF732 domain-containing protein n=1 Tax=Mycobacterium kyorinense TaxID=487514 RepID=UPI0009EDF4AE
MTSGEDTGLTAAADTVVVPDSGSGESLLAWSVDDPAPEVKADDRRPLSLPLRVLLISVLVAAVGLATFVLGGRELPVVSRHVAASKVAAPVQAPAPKAPAPQAMPSLPPTPPARHEKAPPPPQPKAQPKPAPAPPPAPPQAVPNADALFLNAIQQIFGQPSPDPGTATSTARAVCVRLQNGTATPEEVIADTRAGTPGVTAAEASEVFNAAVTFYCPNAAVAGYFPGEPAP